MLSYSIPAHSSPLLRGMGLDRVRTRAIVPPTSSKFEWRHLLFAGTIGGVVVAGGFLLLADQSPSHAAVAVPSAAVALQLQASGDARVEPIGNPVDWDAIEASPDPSPASVAAYGS
jgi:hypothetical protein